MGKSNRVGDLDLKYDPAHEEREWITQRIGWTLMALLALAALIGLLGPGPLSDKTEGKIGGPLRVEYQRFGRYQAPAELKIYCRPKGREHFELSFDRAFIQVSEIKEISPKPDETRTDGDRYVYQFRKGDAEEHLVTFRMHGEKFGKATSNLTLDGQESVHIQIFYWP